VSHLLQHGTMEVYSIVDTFPSRNRIMRCIYNNVVRWRFIPSLIRLFERGVSSAANITTLRGGDLFPPPIPPTRGCISRCKNYNAVDWGFIPSPIPLSEKDVSCTALMRTPGSGMLFHSRISLCKRDILIAVSGVALVRTLDDGALFHPR
jgi:hypothetical protein